MKVWQLIKTLQEFDDDLEVVVPIFDNDILEVTNEFIVKIEQNEHNEVEIWT